MVNPSEPLVMGIAGTDICRPMYVIKGFRFRFQDSGFKICRFMPEIEAPGHCRHVQQVYPEVFGSCGILRASEATFAALDRLIGEVAELFPHSENIHIGGDEAAIERWLWDEDSRSFMAEHHLQDVHGLYTEYVARVAELVLKRGRAPVVWEGFPESGNGRIDKRCIVFAWESLYQTAPSLLKAGFKVINASWVPMYIVAPEQYASPFDINQWNVYTWKNWWPRSEAYHNDITVAPTQSVIGGQLCAWGDRMGRYMDDARAVRDEFRLICERMPMLCDRTWNAASEAAPTSYATHQHAGDILAKLLRGGTEK